MILISIGAQEKMLCPKWARESNKENKKYLKYFLKTYFL